MTGAGDNPEIGRLVDHLFRRQAGRMVAGLTRLFGPAHLDLAEEVVQDALLQALKTWPFRGVPEDPAGWLFAVARNRALDAVRRHAVLKAKQPAIELWFANDHAPINGAAADPHFEAEIADDQLRLIFMCCHPDLGRDGRLALTLKTAGGFGVAEIAGAFLTGESTVAQRLVRAKRRIRERDIGFDMPAPPDLDERLGSVLEVLYLMFNEGYAAYVGEHLTKPDVCHEAIRLTMLVAENPKVGRPEAQALLALLLFQGARLPARVDASGELMLLSEQDRTLWNRQMIADGMRRLKAAAAGDALSQYHLLAGIASCHALAPDFTATDWPAILSYYDLLMAAHPSPVTALNRSVVVAMLDGPDAGLDALGDLEGHPALARYYLLPATRGELLRRAGRIAEAQTAFRVALDLATAEPVRRFLRRKLQ
ncbi:MAG: hypothetical protein MI806_07255 [Minwuiales bacterium]|nr:hypothetical protein [Minwuiales bacterium]